VGTRSPGTTSGGSRCGVSMSVEKCVSMLLLGNNLRAGSVLQHQKRKLVYGPSVHEAVRTWGHEPQRTLTVVIRAMKETAMQHQKS
jgi:hypothetical protein